MYLCMEKEREREGVEKRRGERKLHKVRDTNSAIHTNTVFKILKS